MKRNLLIIGMLAVSAVSAPCLAITPTAPPPAAQSAAPQKSLDPQAAKAMRDDSSGLRKGAIEAVSVGGGTFHVYSQRMTFDRKQVKVYGRDGKPASIYALRSGANIRFTLDATDPMRRRVAVIYLD